MNSTPENAALRDEVNALRWFHQIDFGNGIVSPGWIGVDKIKRQSRYLFDPMPVAGKTVLDIGCWDGAYSVEATRRGARQVLATDHFVWHSPVGDRRAFDLTRRHLAPSIEVRDIDIPELSIDSVGRFDIVLFCGVFYHLRHPFEAVERISKIATECFVLETRLLRTLDPRPFMRFYPNGELDGDPTNWWAPNRACVEAMLRDVGFKTIRFSRPDYRFKRGIFHAWR